MVFCESSLNRLRHWVIGNEAITAQRYTTISLNTLILRGYDMQLCKSLGESPHIALVYGLLETQDLVFLLLKEILQIMVSLLRKV